MQARGQMQVFVYRSGIRETLKWCREPSNSSIECGIQAPQTERIIYCEGEISSETIRYAPIKPFKFSSSVSTKFVSSV